MILKHPPEVLTIDGSNIAGWLCVAFVFLMLAWLIGNLIYALSLEEIKESPDDSEHPHAQE